MATVYPRVYGGTRIEKALERTLLGLSPRVRGNLFVAHGRRFHVRSIPACTGEPAMPTTVVFLSWVYPRVYGGTSLPLRERQGILGLSPRVRGNHRSEHGVPKTAGSIPACTGEPRCPADVRTRPRVYPRVYGGTSSTVTSEYGGWGLSPRVRGNLAAALGRVVAPRSIPACTGEPDARSRSIIAIMVYPRVYGGTGSIPACTGEPLGWTSRLGLGTVYPRGHRPPGGSIPAWGDGGTP